MRAAPLILKGGFGPPPGSHLRRDCASFAQPRWGALALLAVLGLVLGSGCGPGGLLTATTSPPPPPQPSSSAASSTTSSRTTLPTSTASPRPTSSAPPQGTETFPELDRNHTNGQASYDRTPPAGGRHNAVWLNCGFYTSPVPNENAVHSLEHGAVWVTYQVNLSPAAVGTLRALVSRLDPGPQHYVIVSPYAGLPTPVVASAWGNQIRLPSAADPGLAQFITYFRQGPQTPEPGAPCSGGTGSPES